MYVYAHIYIYIYIYTCIHTYIHSLKGSNFQGLYNIYIYIYIYIYIAYLEVSDIVPFALSLRYWALFAFRKPKRSRICIYIYIYIYIYIHTYIHIHTHMCRYISIYILSLSKRLSRSSMLIYWSRESLVCVNSCGSLHIQFSAFNKQNKVIYNAKTVFLSNQHGQ